MFLKLLKNPQFWLSILALVQTIVLNYLGVPKDIWVAIDAILVVMIGSLTAEQVADKVVLGLRETIVELRKLSAKK